MIMRDAARSLLKDLDRAICYWIVFVLSSMFMYLFFHISLSEAIGVAYIYGKNDLPTYLTTFDVMICMIVVFLANDFYVKKKSRELAVILMCGGTYGQLVKFLIVQTAILMVISIPVGILLGRTCFPLVGLLLNHMAGYEVEISSGHEAAVFTTIIIIMEVFWCTFVNLGYCYRNSIYSLLQGEEKIKVKMPWGVELKGIQKICQVMKAVWPLLYFGCAFLLFSCGEVPERIPLLGVIGVIGLWQTIDKVILPWLEDGSWNQWCEDGEKLVYMGLFREDLKMAKLYITLFIFTANLLCALMAGKIHQWEESVLCLLSFSIIIPLLSLSLLFRFATESAGRKRQLGTLLKIGYTQKQLNKIIEKESLCLYGFIMATSLVYILNIVIVLGMYRLVPLEIGGTIIAIFVVSLTVCGGLSCLYNSKRD